MSRPVHPTSPWRTLLSPVWMRDHRWVIRERADHFAIRAWTAIGCLFLTCVAVALVGRYGALILPGVGSSILLAWALAKPGMTSVVDFREAELLVDVGSDVPLRSIRGVVFGTGLHARRQLNGPPIATQVWTLGVLDERRLLQLSAHANEYALFEAAWQLAVALQVPLHDRSGPHGTEHVWAAPPSAEARRGRVQTKHVLESSPPGDAATVVPSVTPDGSQLQWTPSFRGRRIILLVAVLVFGATASLFTRADLAPYRVANWMGLALTGWLLFLALQDLVGRTWSQLTVDAASVVLRARDLVPWTRRLRRTDLLGVRLSQRLMVESRDLTDRRPPRSLETRVDLLGRGRRLARISLPEAEASALCARLEAALASHR